MSLDNRSYHKVRQSYYEQPRHINDNLLHLGYDYKYSLLEKTTSKEILSNPQQYGMLSKLNDMLYNIIETTKNIKKHFSIAHDKNTKNIN